MRIETYDGEGNVLCVGNVSSGMTRDQLLARVKADAERARQKVISPGTGKALSYIEKREQANAVHALGKEAADALTDYIDRFPTLAAGVGIEAPTLWEMAQLVIAKSEQWATLSYDIERTEAAAVKAIREAASDAAADAIYEAVTWP